MFVLLGQQDDIVLKRNNGACYDESRGDANKIKISKRGEEHFIFALCALHSFATPREFLYFYFHLVAVAHGKILAECNRI